MNQSIHDFIGVTVLFNRKRKFNFRLSSTRVQIKFVYKISRDKH